MYAWPSRQNKYRLTPILGQHEYNGIQSINLLPYTYEVDNLLRS